MKSDQGPVMLTSNELARMLKISMRSLMETSQCCLLPAPIQLGGSIRWRADDVLPWIAKGCPQPSDLEEVRRKDQPYTLIAQGCPCPNKLRPTNEILNHCCGHRTDDW